MHGKTVIGYGVCMLEEIYTTITELELWKVLASKTMQYLLMVG